MLTKQNDRDEPKLLTNGSEDEALMILDQVSTTSETMPSDSMELEEIESEDEQASSTQDDEACHFFDVVLFRLLNQLSALEQVLDPEEEEGEEETGDEGDDEAEDAEMATEVAQDSMDTTESSQTQEENEDTREEMIREGIEDSTQNLTDQEIASGIDAVKHLWSTLKQTLDETSPPMGNDPEVVEMLTATEEALEALEVESLEIEVIHSIKAKLSKALETMRPLDVDKLCALLSEHQMASQSMDGKDVLLFLGGSGAGKTTTILFLAGTTFEDVFDEASEDFHLQPVEFPDPNLAEFRTSGGSKSVTKTVHCFEISVNDKPVVLCDVPGFGDTEGREVDIANGIGIVRAIQKAKSVKPVLVLSQTGMGDRYQGLTETVETISRLLGGDCDSASVKAFDYLFTKYEPKYGPRMHQILRGAVKKGPFEKGSLECAVLEDMATKTKPKAQLVSPLDGNPHDILQHLTSGIETQHLDPKLSFREFVPPRASNQLQLQIQFLKSGLAHALQRLDLAYAARLLKQLEGLANVLTQANEPYMQAYELAVQCLNEARENVTVCARRFRNIVEHKTFVEDLNALKASIDGLDKFETFRAECLSHEPSASEFVINILNEVITESAMRLFQFDPSLSIEEVLGLQEVYAADLRRLNDIRGVFPEAGEDGYLRGLNQYAAVATRLIREAETCLNNVPEGLASFVGLVQAYENTRCELLLLDPESNRVQAIESLYGQLVEKVQSTVSAAVSEISTQTLYLEPVCLENGVKWVLGGQETSCLPRLSLSELRKSRDLLCAFADTLGRLPGYEGMSEDDILQARKSLDSTVTESFRLILELSDGHLATTKSEEEAAGLIETHKGLENLLGLCMYMQQSFRGLEMWPDPVGRATLPLLDKLSGHQHALHEYKARLQTKIEEARKEMATVSGQAKNFLRRLRQETKNTARLLEELSQDECWPAWEAKRTEMSGLLKEKKGKKRGFWGAVGAVGTMLGFSSESSSQPTNTEGDGLDQILDEILSLLQSRLGSATRCLCSVRWGTLACEKLCHVFFKQVAPSIAVYLAFLRLQSVNPTLGEEIRHHGNFSSEGLKLSACEVAMTIALKRLRLLALELVKTNRFRESNELLLALKENSRSIEAFRSLLSLDRFQNPGTTKNARNAFVESIKACPDYEIIRRAAIDAAMKVESYFNALSWMDEQRIKSTNEFDRLQFYRNVIAQLKSASTCACLAPHVTDDPTRVKLHGMKDLAILACVTETQKIGEQIHKLLPRFPRVAQDLPMLQIWLGNLTSVDSVFGDHATAVAERARTQRSEAESFLADTLDKIAQAPTTDLEELTAQLIQLKKASVEIGCWRTIIDKAIDKIISRASSSAPNAGRFILDLSVALKNVEEEDDAAAQRLLSQHECFVGAMNAVFNAATARQGIDYVLRELDLTPGQSRQLKRIYNDFCREYSDYVREGLLKVLSSDPESKEQFCQWLSQEALSVATDLTIEYEAQLISLCALLFSYWSLSSTNSFVHQHQSDRNLLGGEDPMNFLRKPHAAQVVAVLSLLNYHEPRLQVLKSHMCELKTGEGKSIVLGVTATILALMGCFVNCVCYSEHLSGRDYNDFVDMFRRFHVDEHIQYDSIDGFCGRYVAEEMDPASIAKKLMLGKRAFRNRGGSLRNERPRVLLVDEVDVLFKEDFFGSTYIPLSTLKSPALTDLARYIWQHAGDVHSANIMRASPTLKLLQMFPPDVHPLVESEIRRMLDSARRVFSDVNEKYTIVNDKIAYKRLDGLTTNTYYGYENLFVCLKEHARGRIKDLQYCMSLNAQSGRFSYAEIPMGFDAILGVTGTLRGFGDLKMGILKKKYRITHFSHIPSVYGANKLTFAGDCPRDVILCDSLDDFHLELRSEIDRRRKPLNGVVGTRRPVMVFFGSRSAMEAFYSSEHLRAIRENTGVRMASEETHPSEKQSTFLKATESAAVTLFIREFGRGTDFKCFDSKVLQAGGVHVIQAFFALDIAEELQLKGRAARQGAQGSYSMVLNAADLKKELDITHSDVQKMRNESKFYSLLREWRSTKASTMLKSVNKEVDEAAALHYRSMAFVKAAREGRREEALDFLFEINSVPGRNGNSFSGNNEKKKFLAEREARLAAHNFRQGERRKSAKDSEPAFEPPPVLLLQNGDSTHYGVLGVTRTATKPEISRAFRRLAKIHHPDKSSHANANEIFCRIKEARNVLMNDAKRAAYDQELEHKAAEQRAK